DLLISDDIFESSNTENYESGNVENFFNTEFVDPLIFDDMYRPGNTNNYESKSSSSSSSNESISLNVTKTHKSQDDKKYSELRYPIELNKKNEFAFTITHSEKDKGDRIPWRHTYKYAKGRPYVPRKEAHVINDCDSDHNTIGYTFYINAYRCKSKNKKQIGYDKPNDYDVDSDHSLEKTKNVKKRKSLKRCGICNTK
ncbi:11958_t:CDS:2, partial [Gigaspora margarita]